MELKNRGVKMSPYGRNLFYSEERRLQEKYNINYLSYPIKNQNGEAASSSPLTRGCCNPFFDAKVLVETCKHTPTKQKKDKIEPTLDLTEFTYLV
jgi:hypothetical protein